MSRISPASITILAPIVATIALGACQPSEVAHRQRLGDDVDLVFDSQRSMYFLQRSGDSSDPDGLFDGPVVRVGWNDRFVWCECELPFHAEPTGWMLLDRERALQLGPFTPVELARRMRDICGCDSLVSHPSAEAFALASASDD